MVKPTSSNQLKLDLSHCNSIEVQLRAICHETKPNRQRKNMTEQSNNYIFEPLY